MVTGFESDALMTLKALVAATNRLARAMENMQTGFEKIGQSMQDFQKAIPNIVLDDKQMSELEKIVKGTQKTSTLYDPKET